MAVGGQSSARFEVTDAYIVGVAAVRVDPGNRLADTINWTDGDGAEQVEDTPTGTLTVAGGVGTIDLSAFTRLDGTAIAPTAAKVFTILAPASNTDAVVLDFATTEGWDAAIDGTVTLKPGSAIHLQTRDAAGYAVGDDATDKIGVAGTNGDVLRFGFGFNVS